VEDQSQGGAPGAKRGRTTLTVIFARRQDARREGDGRSALAGAATSRRRAPVMAGCGPAFLRQSRRPQGSARKGAVTLPLGDRRVPATPAGDGGMLRRSGAPDARSLRNQQRTQAVRRLAPQAPPRRSKDSSHHIGQHPLSATVCREFPLVKWQMRGAGDQPCFGNTCLRVPVSRCFTPRLGRG
jgi:hypothetical protein